MKRQDEHTQSAGEMPDGSWGPMHLDGSWSDIWCVQERWSQHAFGSDKVRGPVGPLKHLAREVAEALANPSDISEFADIILLAFDSARRAGHGYWELKNAVTEKLDVNQRRKWPKSTDNSEPVEHSED